MVSQSNCTQQDQSRTARTYYFHSWSHRASSWVWERVQSHSSPTLYYPPKRLKTQLSRGKIISVSFQVRQVDLCCCCPKSTLSWISYPTVSLHFQSILAQQMWNRDHMKPTQLQMISNSPPDKAIRPYLHHKMIHLSISVQLLLSSAHQFQVSPSNLSPSYIDVLEWWLTLHGRSHKKFVWSLRWNSKGAVVCAARACCLTIIWIGCRCQVVRLRLSPTRKLL